MADHVVGTDFYFEVARGSYSKLTTIPELFTQTELEIRGASTSDNSATECAASFDLLILED